MPRLYSGAAPRRARAAATRAKHQVAAPAQSSQADTPEGGWLAIVGAVTLALLFVGAITLLEVGPPYLIGLLSPPPAPINVVWTPADDLEACSPFASLDGRRQLVFNAKRGIVAEGSGANTEDGQLGLASDLQVAVDEPNTAAVSPEGSIVRGRFQVNAATRTVLVELPQTSTTYHLLTATALDQDPCILARGPTSAADLDQSWFGATTDPPLDDAARADP